MDLRKVIIIGGSMMAKKYVLVIIVCSMQKRGKAEERTKEYGRNEG